MRNVASTLDHLHVQNVSFTKSAYLPSLKPDENDGMITTHAEFLGTNTLESALSDIQIVVVYSVKGEKCTG